MDQVGPVDAGVEGGVLGQGSGGGVQLETAIGGGASPLAVGVDPDAGVSDGMSANAGAGPVRATAPGGGLGEGRGGGVGRRRGGAARRSRRGPARVGAWEGHGAGDHLEVTVIGEDWDHGSGASGHTSDDVVGNHG